MAGRWREEGGGKGFGSEVGDSEAGVMDGGVKKRFAGGREGDDRRRVAAARVGGMVKADEDILGIFKNG
ncbi:hypothetical protein ACSBR1_006743 [Camellia fascicularis]